MLTFLKGQWKSECNPYTGRAYSKYLASPPPPAFRLVHVPKVRSSHLLKYSAERLRPHHWSLQRHCPTFPFQNIFSGYRKGRCQPAQENRGPGLGTGSAGILHTILKNSISHVTSPSASFFSICNPPKPGINRGLSTCASAKNFCAVSTSRNLNTPMNDFSSTPQPSAFPLEIQPPSLFNAIWRKETHAHSHASRLGRAGVSQ
jgi:hypothetical protein